ncbi:MAG: ribonuclease HI [Candidatus Zambryskibacteria bacterium]|nr:ribonuclease HI [Candidatus Zambryskibacteria bacterium]
MITIYIDGSSRGNPGPGGWAGIVVTEERVVELGGREDHTTNNRMELMGAIKSIEFSISNFQFSKIQINTDSEYVMKGITLWIHNWIKKGWKTAAKKPVLNQDLWQELWNLCEGKNIEWKYVAGHSGHAANERCDEIATSFADNINIDLYEGPRHFYRHF